MPYIQQNLIRITSCMHYAYIHIQIHIIHTYVYMHIITNVYI